MNWISKKDVNIDLVNNLLNESLKLNQLTNGGPNVIKLEEFIKNKFKIDNKKSVIVVANGSVALHSITSAISYYEKKNINWATQSFTFPSSVQSSLKNIKIIDIDKDGGLDLKYIDDSIQGIIITNIFGNVVDISKYELFCKKKNIFLIFDNAATAFTFYKGKNCLNYGNACTISFHHTKPFGFGEGGAIICDKKYEHSVRCLNNFGIGLTDKYWVPDGNNNKMSETSAVYILQYLIDNQNKIISKHNDLYLYFKKQIIKNNITHFRIFPSFHNEVIVPSCFCILFENYNDSIRERLLENNIQARKYYHPLDNSKVANDIFDSILCISCNIDMDKSDIDKIFDILSKF